MPDEISNTPRRRRIVICRGVYCNEGRRADNNFKHLQPLLAEINGDSDPPYIKFELASCLSMCGAGPNLIIYPDNIRCNHVDEAEIRRIVDEYLRQ